MTSKSKIKGSSFERECAKFLSELYSASFHRNLNGSGAYIGGRNVFRKNTLSESQIRNSKGDITPPESISVAATPPVAKDGATQACLAAVKASGGPPPLPAGV